jgi:hypothetical protein
MISLGHKKGLKDSGYIYISEKQITNSKLGIRYAYIIEKEGTLFIGYEQLNKQIYGMPISIFEKVKPAQKYTEIHQQKYCQVCHDQNKQPIKHPEYKDLKACKQCHNHIYDIFKELINQTTNAQILQKTI